jgi:L-threonylcarbamoyladenylate synthase
MIKYNFLIHQLKRSEVVALPTDTIYGFSTLPTNQAINRLLTIKQRDSNKGLILLASDYKYFADFVSDNTLELLKSAYENVNKATTFIVPSPHCLAVNNKLALRITNNKLISYICNKLGSAITSTSANLSGKKTINNTYQLKKQFGKQVKYYLPAKTTSNEASSIIDLITMEMYR